MSSPSRQVYAKVAKAATLKNLVKAFDKVVSEFVWICNQHGIRYTGMDDSRCVIVDLHLQKNFFQEYNVQSEDDEVQLGIRHADLNEIIKIVPDDASLKMEESAVLLQVTWDDEPEDVRTSSANLIEISREFMSVPPDEDFDVHISMSPDHFKYLIQSVHSIGAENVTVTVQASVSGVPAKLLLEARAEGTGAISIEQVAGQNGIVWKGEADISREYPVKHLKDHATRFCGIGDTIRLAIGSKSTSLKVIFPIGHDIQENDETSDKENKEDTQEHPRSEGGASASTVTFLIAALRTENSEDSGVQQSLASRMMVA